MPNALNPKSQSPKDREGKMVSSSFSFLIILKTFPLNMDAEG